MTIELVEDEPTGETVRGRPGMAPSDLAAYTRRLAAMVQSDLPRGLTFALVVVDVRSDFIAVDGPGDRSRAGQVAQILLEGAAQLCHADPEHVLVQICPCIDCRTERHEHEHGQAHRMLDGAVEAIALHLGMPPGGWATPNDVVDALRAKVPAAELPPATPYVVPDGLPPWIDDDLGEGEAS